MRIQIRIKTFIKLLEASVIRIKCPVRIWWPVQTWIKDRQLKVSGQIRKWERRNRIIIKVICINVQVWKAIWRINWRLTIHQIQTFWKSLYSLILTIPTTRGRRPSRKLVCLTFTKKTMAFKWKKSCRPKLTTKCYSEPVVLKASFRGLSEAKAKFQNLKINRNCNTTVVSKTAWTISKLKT